MKKDILAIVGDDYGNSKWTKNTSNLALELAKRVELASTPSKASTGFNSKENKRRRSLTPLTLFLLRT